jgi:hypothetical protein
VGVFGSSSKGQSWLSTFRKPEDSALASLAHNISKVALAGAEALKADIQASNDKVRIERWFLVFCEFLYFFMHIANRLAYKELGHAKRCKFQDELYPLLVRPNIEAIVGHWPANLKDGIERDFIEKLGDAEVEYGACKQMLDKDNLFSVDALFSKFASNICELVEAEKSDPVKYVATFQRVMDLGLDSFKELNLRDSIIAVSKIL